MIDLSRDTEQKIDEYIAMKLTEIAIQNKYTKEAVIEVYKYIRREM